MRHQERTEQAAQGTQRRDEKGELMSAKGQEVIALWQIAHSLAAIADALEKGDDGTS